MRPLSPDFAFHTERLRLRIPDAADVPHVFSATRVAGFNDGMLWNPPATIEELDGPLARARAAWLAAEWYQFTLETRPDRQFVGRIALRPVQEEIAPEDLGGAAHVLDVGYWTHPDQQGRGYMTEALGAVVDLAFGTMGADAIVAFHTLWNEASRKVLEKAGFRRVRVFSGGFVKNGVAEDDALLRLDRSGWSAR